MKDFTVEKYGELLDALKNAGYRFLTYEQYCRAPKTEDGEPKTVILRHDVDKKPLNSLRIAQLEASKGICASYYFRIVKESFNPEVIRQIASLGHEIGYHYEDMSLCKGDPQLALQHFERKLSLLRTFYPVATVCMHGAPTSKYDGRALWRETDYRQYNIIGEPYFDTDFSSRLYLTDTGGCWDGFKVSVRDKIPGFQDEWTKKGWVFHTTDQLLSAIRADSLPSLMLTTHPQRWTDDAKEWRKERLTQSVKNKVKRVLIWAKGY